MKHHVYIINWFCAYYCHVPKFLGTDKTTFYCLENAIDYIEHKLENGVEFGCDGCRCKYGRTEKVEFITHYQKAEDRSVSSDTLCGLKISNQ